MSLLPCLIKLCSFKSLFIAFHFVSTLDITFLMFYACIRKNRDTNNSFFIQRII